MQWRLNSPWHPSYPSSLSDAEALDGWRFDAYQNRQETITKKMTKKMTAKRKKREQPERISLPLTLDEALSALLQTRPEPKKPTKKTKAK